MLLCDIEAVVSRIERLVRGDPEAAHNLEDELLVEILEFIASGNCDDPVRYAQEVLKIVETDFPR